MQSRSNSSFIFLATIISILLPIDFAAADRLISPSDSKLVSVQFNDTDIHSALKILAEVSDKNIVFHRDVTGKVKNFQLLNVPAGQAFDTLLRMNGLYAVAEGNVIIVYPIGHYIADAQARQQLDSM